MKKLLVAVLAVAFAALSGCASTSGSMVGTSAVKGDTAVAFSYPAGAWPTQLWTNDD
jgi:uncharacterized protein YceK